MFHGDEVEEIQAEALLRGKGRGSGGEAEKSGGDLARPRWLPSLALLAGGSDAAPPRLPSNHTMPL